MQLRNQKVGTWLGVSSMLLSTVTPAYIFYPDAFPAHALTEFIVILGGTGGSLVAAIVAALVGSRWWFVATLGAVVDVLCLWGFSP